MLGESIILAPNFFGPFANFFTLFKDFLSTLFPLLSTNYSLTDFVTKESFNFSSTRANFLFFSLTTFSLLSYLTISISALSSIWRQFLFFSWLIFRIVISKISLFLIQLDGFVNLLTIFQFANCLTSKIFLTGFLSSQSA